MVVASCYRNNIAANNINLKTGAGMSDTYTYKGLPNLTPQRLFFWILLDKTEEQLGLKDLGALLAIVAGQPFIPTRGKFGGATPGTSIASLAARTVLDVDLPFRLPTITGSLTGLRIAFTRNLGAFVGRTIPIVGEVLLAYDVSRILWNTVTTYNAMVSQADRLL